MKRMPRTLKRTEGFTTIELLITITILGILTAVAIASYDTLKAKARYSQVRADMDAIAQAAYNDYSTNAIWAPLSFSVMPANWAANHELSRWPAPPCPGWYYSWEDWSAFGYSVTQVTLRRGNNTLLWGYCVDTLGGGSSNCQISDPIFGGSSATDLSAIVNRYVYCNE
jgi:prepilin-type N-terminal cleavage/methylation domain-containing protein